MDDKEKIEQLRSALAPFATEVTVTPNGRFSIASDRKCASAVDLIRARRIYDLTAATEDATLAR